MSEPEDLDAALVRLADHAESPGRAAVALELADRSAALRRAGHHEQAIRVADALLEHFTSDPPPEAPHVAVDALLAKAANLFDLGRNDEGLAVYDQLVDRYGEDPATHVRTKVAEALAFKGHLLFRLRDGSEEAIAVFDELVARYGDASEPALRAKVASGLQWKALALQRVGRAEDATAAAEELLTRFAAATEPELTPQVAFALEQRTMNLMKLGHNEEASAACDELLARVREETSPELRELAARTRHKRAHLQVLVGDRLIADAAELFAAERWEAALEIFAEIVDRFAEAVDPALRRRVVLAMSNSVVAQMQLQRFDAASATHKDMVARFADDAIATFDEVARGYGAAAEPEQRRHAAGALANKAGVLRELDRHGDALAALSELIERYSDDRDKTIQELVAQAADHRTALLESADPGDDAD